jgi:hypothetical protein
LRKKNEGLFQSFLSYSLPASTLPQIQQRGQTHNALSTPAPSQLVVTTHKTYTLFSKISEQKINNNATTMHMMKMDSGRMRRM